MRNFAGGILATLVVLTVSGWLYIKLGYVDLRATPEPSRLESDLTGTALDAFAARNAPGSRTRSRRPKPTCSMARVFIATSAPTVTADLITR